MEHERLLREVAVKAQVYQMLAEEFEMSAIQEKKETPVVQILDIARPPSVKSGPARARTVVIAFLAGMMLASVIVIYEHLYPAHKNRRNLNRFMGRIRLIRRAPEESTVETDR